MSGIMRLIILLMITEKKDLNPQRSGGSFLLFIVPQIDHSATTTCHFQDFVSFGIVLYYQYQVN